MLRIGAHNIHYLCNKRDRIFDSSWEYDLEGKKKLWVNAHDIVILCDTKLSAQTYERLNNPFPGFNLYNEFAHENKWGVTVMSRVHLSASRTTHDLHEILRGRLIAVEILLPSETQGAPVKIGIIGVYAPDSSYHAGQVITFFTELKKVISNTKDACDFTYIGGDFNAVMNGTRDSFNYRRPPRTYIRDVQLQMLAAELGLCDPIEDTEPEHNAKEFYTFATANNINDAMDVTYRRIDHILCSSSVGISEYVIDPGGILNPLNLEESRNDAVSDHTPISLLINTSEINAALMPEKFELRTFRKTCYPEPEQLIEWREFKDRFEHVDQILEDDCAIIFSNRDIFLDATEPQKNQYAEALNQILGKILPEPYKKTICPGKNRWLSKEQWKILKYITKVKKTRAAVHYIMKNRNAEVASLFKLAKCRRKFNIPIRDVRDPSPFIEA
jgi:exonuclease III